MGKHIVRLNGTSANSFQVGLQGASISSEAVTNPYTLTLPPALGTDGQALLLDASGNLVFGDVSSGIVNVPYISWVATAGQSVFTSSDLALYPAGTELTVFRNGVLMLPEEYSLAGDTLTVTTYVAAGDVLEIPSRGVVGGSGGGGAGGTDWANTASIAVGDIFAGQTASKFTPGSSFTTSNTATVLAEASTQSNFETSQNIMAKNSVTGTIISAGSNLGTNTPVYRSTDGGQTWTEIVALTVFSSSVFGMTCAQTPSGSLWIVMGLNSGKYATSTDDGLTWTERTNNVSVSNSYCVGYSPTLNLFVWGANLGKILTSPDGITWTERPVFGSSYTQNPRVAKWVPTIGKFIVGYNTQVAVSSDGINWSLIWLPQTTAIYDIAWNDSIVVATATAYVYTTTDGINWTSSPKFNLNSTYTAISWNPDNNMFLFTGGVGVFYSTDNAATWKRAWIGGPSSVFGMNYSLYVGNGQYLGVGSQTSYRMRVMENTVYTDGVTKVPSGTYKNLGISSLPNLYDKTYGGIWKRTA